MRFIVLIAITSSIGNGCASGGKPIFEKAEVIERIGEQDETPAWIHMTKTMDAEGQDIIFLHAMSMSGNARPEACLQAADLGARAEFLKHVQSNITASGQVNDTSVTDDPAYESLTAFIAQGKISGARTIDRYWEKREESDAVTGERILKMYCAVKVSVKKSELERQLRLALGQGGNTEIRKALIDAQKSFIENVGNETNATAE